MTTLIKDKKFVLIFICKILMAGGIASLIGGFGPNPYIFAAVLGLLGAQTVDVIFTLLA
jgi:hypothetical protein